MPQLRLLPRRDGRSDQKIGRRFHAVRDHRAHQGTFGNKVSLYADELNALVFAELKISRPSDKLAEFIGECINLGVSKNIFVRSISDRISLY